MGANYLKIAFRNIRKHKGYSFINIFGLAFGLAVAFILTFYVLNDVTFDRFHENADNIYRIISVNTNGRKNAITAGPLVLKVKESIPEIIASTRITSFGQARVQRLDDESGAVSDENTITGRALITDPGFFDVFSFKILSGKTADALKDPGSVFLTPDFAETLFGNENPLGRPLTMPGEENAVVAGIVEKPPNNSHIQFDLIIPLIVERNPVWWDSWENLNLRGYTLLSDNADIVEVEQKMNRVARNNDFYEPCSPRLQPLLDIHLGSSDYDYDLTNFGKNDSVVVFTLGTIGILVLLISCINFVNLSSARAAKRAREVGMRKIVGCHKGQLAVQFIGESVLITVISFILALIFIQMMSPYLNSILDKQLDLRLTDNIHVLAIMLAISIFFGILSGIYPAGVLSSFNPVKVIRGEFQTGRAGVLIRRILVVFQFTITISLIIGVLIIFGQINHLKSINLGYDRENVVAIWASYDTDEDLLKQKLSNFPGVLSMGRSNNLPGRIGYHSQIIPEGTNREDQTAACMYVDEGLFETLSISIDAGRSFSKEFTSDSINSIIVNETLVREVGWDSPLGKRLDEVDVTGTAISKSVVGVVKDFHYITPRQSIEPIIFLLNSRNAGFLFVRISQERIHEIIERLHEVYAELFPDRQLQYFFLDDRFDEQFDSDRSFAGNIGIFSGMAIFIACLGLIGLASHAIEQRRKEVVMRKILGCNSETIVRLLTTDFLKWIALANLFAWPCGYFAMQIWLDEFVYKVAFSLWPFILAGVASFLIAFFTIFYQTVKAAQANPADSLRNE